MTVPKIDRDYIRQRANYSCEFCGISEVDSGGELTIDHFQPLTKGGSNELENLIYCCIKCNQYKFNFFPSSPYDGNLWNPRKENFSKHFLELENGFLHPLTLVGEFTIQRLRLNRPQLVAFRSRLFKRFEEIRLLKQFEDLLLLQNNLNSQFSDLVEEQKQLLSEQQTLLNILIKKISNP